MNFLACFVCFLSVLGHGLGLRVQRPRSPVEEQTIAGGTIDQIATRNTTTQALSDIFRNKMEDLKRGDQVELVILVDGSYSIGAKNFMSEMKFIQKVIADIEVGAKAFRLGVVIYSTRAVIHVDHLSATDPSDVEKCSLLHLEIPRISYPGLNTNTREALEKAERILTRGREGASKVVFLLTDGFSNMGNPLSASDILKEQGVEIFTFGIVNGNVRELEAMASRPVDEHAYLFGSFEEFEGFARRALHQDLSPGRYSAARNSSSCNLLCSNPQENGCCSSEATCTCGLISGHFACLCPPGYYGSGLVGEGCTLCPAGTYNEGLRPGDAANCVPCPDVHHVIAKYPATSRQHCICANGTVSEGDECKIVSCPSLLPPPNGYFVKKKCSNVVNAACGVRCHMGYVLSGSSIRICQKDGTWSGTDPVCQPKSCEAPKSVSSSTVTCTYEEDSAQGAGTFDQHSNQSTNHLKVKEVAVPQYPVGTACTFSCSPGFSLIGSRSRTCLPMLKWSGLKATCKSIRCPSLQPLSSGSIKPLNCTDPGLHHPFGAVCRFHCDRGFQLKGPKLTNCTGKHGTWTGKNVPSRCVDVEPPVIDCPANFSVKTDHDLHFATLKLKLPKTTDNSGKEPIIWSKPPFDDESPLRLIIGKNDIQIYSVDEAGNYAFCAFTVEVRDEESPKVLECMSPPPFFISELVHASTDVAWKDPVFDDNSGIPIAVERTPSTGSFPKGITPVTYVATDATGNSASCTVDITILDNPCSERPSDTNVLWNCTTASEDAPAVCTLSCPEGQAMALAADQGPITFNCTFEGRKAHWTPDVFAGDVDLFPDCSEIIPPDLESEIVLDVTPAMCDDLNALSNDIFDTDPADKNLIVLCEDYEEEAEPDEVEKQKKEEIGITEPSEFQTTTENQVLDSATAKTDSRDEITTPYVEVRTSESDLDSTTRQPSTQTNDLEEHDEDPFTMSDRTEQSYGNNPPDSGYTVEEQSQLMGNNRIKRSNKGVRKRLRIRISHKGSQRKGEPDSVTLDVEKRLNAIRKIYDKGREGKPEPLPDPMTKIICRHGSLPRNGICVKCPKGTFHHVERSACLPCPLGYYQDDEGQVQCISCPDGFSTRKIRRKSIKQCKRIPGICGPGSYGRKANAAGLALAPCVLCPMGSYQQVAGRTSCEPCPESLTSLRSGADSPHHCLSPSAFTDACFGVHCRNGGTCHAEEGLAFCKCPPGFAGSFCERAFDPCGSDPCYNGASCEAVGPVDYFCRCLPGFQGPDCEKEVNECFPDPCNGRGECTDLTNAFMCDCIPGFKGLTCNETIGYCEDLAPCVNGGQCVDTPDGSYTCSCPSGFSGRHCDVIYDCPPDNCTIPDSASMSTPAVCTPSSCRENEKCLVDNNGGLKCVCMAGFRGANCTEEIDDRVVLRFPKYGVTEYAVADFPAGDHNQLSVCVWIETKDTFNYGTIFSYATLDQDNAFTLTDYSGLVLYVMGRHVVTDLQANDGSWHFVCVTWESEGGQWHVFLDGSLYSNGTGLSVGDAVTGSGKMVVGQEQDFLGGGFSDVESFAGRLTNFDVWNHVLSPTQIRVLFEDCKAEFGNVIPWPRLLEGVYGEIQEEPSPFCQSCNTSLELYRGNISYDVIDGRMIATYECESGFVIKFDQRTDDFQREKIFHYRRSCMKFGGWNAKEPKCKRISCGFPGYFLRGSIFGRSYKFEDRIVYTCSQGYFLEGNDTRICLADGTWSGTAPYCRGNSTECKKLLAPRHGSMFVYYNGEKAYSSSLLRPGDRVEFKCDRGHKLTGFAILTCVDGGFWDREPPTCEKIMCPVPTEISGLGPIAVSSHRTIFYPDDVLTITCPSGRQQVIRCGVQGAWNSSSACKITCRNRPPTIRNGHVMEDGIEHPSIGHRLRVVCHAGFRLQGDDFIECSKNGRWIQSRPTVCRRMRCGPPPPPPPAYQIVYEEGHDVGDRIILRCSPGYKSSGEVIIQCQPNGRYSRVGNICSKIECPPPVLPEGYKPRVIERRIHLYKSKVVVECPPGRSLAPGERDSMECGADGAWSPVPDCL